MADVPPRGQVYRGYGARPRQLYAIRNGVMDASRIPAAALPLYEQFTASLREPYVGVTTDGTVFPGLFSLADQGPSTDRIQHAADRYLASLNAEQTARAVLPVTANEWRAWINAFMPYEPHGILLDTLKLCQRDAALRLLQTSLSVTGYRCVRDVMKINGELAALIDDYHDTLKEYMYWLTIFGRPSADEPWGWQLAGHHLDLHCFVLGGQLVMTPAFLGAEPRILEAGKHAGTRIFDEEMDTALALMLAFSPAQRDAATLSRSIFGKDLPPYLNHPTEGRQRASVGQDNLVLKYEGLSAADMSSTQRDLLVNVARCYVRRMASKHAEVWLGQIEAHLDDTYFAWVGAAEESAPFYYKLHSPVLLIEFDCHSGVFLDNDAPEPFHVHTVVRTPNGNDYGRDLLRQHLVRHHGAAPTDMSK
jgi:hypothetical protein